MTTTERIDEVIAEYLRAAAAGSPPSEKEWLERFPDLATDLKAYFSDRRRMEQLAAPLRAAAQAALANLEPVLAPTLAPECTPPGPGSTFRYVGDYEILEEIARGGMGVVFKARQVTVNRIVALKMILAGQFASQAAIERFRSEAISAGNLDHPNIVPIYEVGAHQSQPYFSMKLIEGGSLAQRLAESMRKKVDGADGSAPARIARQDELRNSVRILAGVARAVHHAHQRGIIHRDLKPANILVDNSGEPHVTDFGLAKQLTGEDGGVTHTGQVVGTPAYMAPEQASGKKGAVTTASDIYSLGAILYEMLTGQPPFQGESVMETLKLVLDCEPQPPSRILTKVDRDLEAICLKCLAKEPTERYSSAATMAEDLDCWLAGEPISVRPPGLAAVVWTWLRKNVRAALWTIIIGLVCGGLSATLISLAAMGNLFQNMAKTYAYYPSLRPPLLAFDPHVPEWVNQSSGVLAVVILASMGLLTVWLVRPKDRRGDLQAGLGVGLIAGLASFTLGVGQACVIALTIVPSLLDFKMYGDAAMTPAEQEMDKPKGVAITTVQEVVSMGTAYSQPIGVPAETVLASTLAREQYRLELEARANWAHPSQAIVDRYPDLADRRPRARGALFFPKMITDQINGVFTGIWWGVVISLMGCGGLAVCETLSAGYLLRRDGQWWRILIPHLEMSAALAVPLWWFLAFVMIGISFNALETLLLASLAAVGLVGVTYQWRWLLRWLLYGAWILTGWFPLVRSDFPEPLRQACFYGGIVAWAGVVVLLASYYEHHRRGSWPADGSDQ